MNRRRRGSTFVYAVLLMALVALLMGVTIDLAGSGRRAVGRSEEEARWRFVLEGASAQAAALSTTALFNPTGSQVFDCGGVRYTVTRSSASDPHLLTIAVVAPDGSAQRADVPRPLTATYANYGLFVQNDADFSDDDLVVGSPTVPNHSYFAKVPKVNGRTTMRFYGAVDTAASAAAMAGITVDRVGPVSTDVQGGTLADRSSFLMNLAANSRIGGGTLSSFNFNSLGRTGSHVPLVYCGGTLTLSGTFQGTGTVYATGDITIQLPFKTSGTGAKIVVITNGTVTVKGSGALGAFILAGDTFELQTKNVTVNLIGAAWVKNVKTSSDIVAVYDPEFWDHPEELDDFYLPTGTN